MCATCGCSDHVEGAEGLHAHDHDHAHDHPHDHAPPGDVAKGTDPATRVRLEREILGKNDRLAAQNRAWLAERGVLAVNLISSPGSGKTTLLERLVARLAGSPPLLVIEGDQATSRDADRIRAAGARAIQINTGAGCHLDAHMVLHALADLDPPRGSIVMIENVGNLVCPALFDLGEAERMVLFSVTEGEDKPLKYPHVFRSSSVLVLGKVDLLPYVPFDRARALENAALASPRARVFEVSATRGDGLDELAGFLRRRAAELDER